MRLVNISNRLPFSVTEKEGKLRFKDSPGGLTTGLWSYLERAKESGAGPDDSLWIGWPGSTIGEEHHEKVRTRALKEYKASPVFLSEEAMNRFYLGFCNETIWPLFHYFPSYVVYDAGYWEEYRQVNQAFFEAVRDHIQPGDVVWVHDYQLMLLPRLIREHFPSQSIGFFLHIPFPSFELFRLLPARWREEILEGLLGASLLGFHTHDYTRHFLSCVLRTLGHEHNLGRIALRERTVKADTFPMGINYDKFEEMAQSPEVAERAGKLKERFADRKVIVSVDRLDYTKGLIKRLQGYELFLQRNPQWHTKVVLVLAVSPSRTEVKMYQAMKRELDEWVGRIVGSYGTMHWTPIIYQYRDLPFPQLVSMYRQCSVALVTPLRDGMNLVAKEFLATRIDQTGVLILSEMAGAAKEMGEALIINPNHDSEIAGALEQALSMTEEEQQRRNRIMQDRLRRYNVVRWAEDFVNALHSAEKSQAAVLAKIFGRDPQRAMQTAYLKANRRAILLDYDGTLVSFVNDPQQARPDEQLLDLLGALAGNASNELAIISGRPRLDLEKWLGHLPVSLVAEHGAWFRPKGEEWRKVKAISTEWKEQIRSILQLYVDRLPGAFVEEKEYSLAWHYRRSDPEQGSIRAKELQDDLADYTRSIDVQVLEGNKVIEVRNAGVNKGVGALECLALANPDFILAFGDDWTDEDMFRILPETAISVRVGLESTAARFRIPNPLAVRQVLQELSQLGTSVGVDSG